MTLASVFAALWLVMGRPAAVPGDLESDFMAPLPDAGTFFLRAAPLPAVRSKKALWLEEKRRRPRLVVTTQKLAAARRASLVPPVAFKDQTPRTPLVLPPVGSRIRPITTIYSVHLKEALPLLPGAAAYPAFKYLLRDHYSQQSTTVDPALLQAVISAALEFGADRVEVVSGYRSPKYNLSLRKKGRQVAQSSQHCDGKAVDFRLRGVTTNQLWAFVRGLKLGGVGIYAHSAFVHCDTGPIRFWKGD